MGGVSKFDRRDSNTPRDREKKEEIEKIPKEVVEKWDEEAVTEWLNKHQLGKFSENFKEQSIDGLALLNLEEKYFSSLGVKLIGDKIKFEKALETIR